MTQLAAEVLARGYGPGGPADKVPPMAPGASVKRVLAVFESTGSRDISLSRSLYELIADSIQVLEHASLLRLEAAGEQVGRNFYALTRLGHAALAKGAVDRSCAGRVSDPADVPAARRSLSTRPRGAPGNAARSSGSVGNCPVRIEPLELRNPKMRYTRHGISM